MKKLLFILSILAISYVGKSQNSFNQTVFNPTGTITNTGVDTMSVKVAFDYLTIGIQPVITKVSGTVAGTAILYGSLDNINFVSTGDTLTLTNATTNTTVWSKLNQSYSFFRILVGGSTTVSATASAKFIGRRPNR